MFDYKLLVALCAVIEEGGFERAARRLGLSQSAVSQRIGLLEARIGQPVVERTPQGPLPTPVGCVLLNHAQRVRWLEKDLEDQVPALAEPGELRRLRMAINADSLATWWPEVVADFLKAEDVLFDWVVEDQEVGLRRMRSGEVAACVCATAEPVSGARSLYLGQLRYCVVVSPAYRARYLEACMGAEGLLRVPGLLFDANDLLPQRFFREQGVHGEPLLHVCPSSEGFLRLVETGVGWGLLPELQVRDGLRAGRLLDLFPGQGPVTPLYWHYWRQGGEVLERLTRHLLTQAPGWLLT